ncbi:MAG: hypothetical protein LQ343_002190 [Gyalolechia ehrenbergii]|nr:MAG: hypothetical protein LQ343_002190 [Gyalolechia ehrenbergii]
MPEPVRNTVDRLDRPSAYYLGRNKRRKFNKDHVGREDRERTPEAPEDPLKDATTLYVGNLYAERDLHLGIRGAVRSLRGTDRSTQQKNRYMNYLQSEEYII